MRLWVEAGSEMKRILWVRKHSNNSVPTLKHKARWNEASNQPMVNYNEHWNIDNYDEDGKIQSKKKKNKKKQRKYKAIDTKYPFDWLTHWYFYGAFDVLSLFLFIFHT